MPTEDCTVVVHGKLEGKGLRRQEKYWSCNNYKFIPCSLTDWLSLSFILEPDVK